MINVLYSFERGSESKYKDRDCALTHSLLTISPARKAYILYYFWPEIHLFSTYFKCFTWTEDIAIQKLTNVDRVLDINKMICDINNYTYSIQNSLQLQIT